ncbi:MAG: hypothetical protein LUC99_03280 [Clostridiales bacterium]|nr:hypothetical protein [Clostridiales bacterium]MCD8223865.1 hypothetical protein [Clostridiales bacterium]
MTNEDRQIQADRMRFTKNTLSSNLAILAILFDVFYFVSIYRSDVGSYYYNILIGASIVYNLLFMLAVFLSSEGVKNYKEGYSWLLAVVGILQIVRIFIIPARAHGAVAVIGGVETEVMGDGQYIRLIVFLLVSAACLLASAAINYNKCRILKEHMKTLEGKIV